MQDEPPLLGWRGPALCGPTLSGSRSHLTTSKLTSLFFPYWGEPGLRGLPSSRDKEGSGCSGHPESTADSPSGALPSFLRTRLTYSAGDGGPSASLPSQPFQGGGRVCFFFCSWPRKGSGEEGRALSRGHTLRSRAPWCPIWTCMSHSVGLGPTQAHLSLGVTPAVRTATTHKAVHFSPVLDV